MTPSGMNTSEHGEELWAPKRTLTLEAARKHSQNIKRLRWILVLTAIVITAGLIWTFMQKTTTTLPDDNADEAVKMINPRYTGRTKDGMPFYLTAAEAVRKVGDTTAVDLMTPVLEFYRDKTSEVSTISASSGIYDDVDKILNLHQTVVLKTDDGNMCTTSHARIYTQTKVIEGDEPIECTGSFGELKGAAFEIRNNFTVFTFKNGMSAVLEQAQE